MGKSCIFFISFFGHFSTFSLFSTWKLVIIIVVKISQLREPFFIPCPSRFFCLFPFPFCHLLQFSLPSPIPAFILLLSYYLSLSPAHVQSVPLPATRGSLGRSYWCGAAVGCVAVRVFRVFLDAVVDLQEVMVPLRVVGGCGRPVARF